MRNIKKILGMAITSIAICSCGGNKSQEMYDYYMEKARESDAKIHLKESQLQYGNDNNDIDPIVSSYAGRPVTNGEFRRMEIEKEKEIEQEYRLKAEGAKSTARKSNFR